LGSRRCLTSYTVNAVNQASTPTQATPAPIFEG
jgi:hypothetical protein